jgi:hypothetical protein
MIKIFEKKSFSHLVYSTLPLLVKTVGTTPRSFISNYDGILKKNAIPHEKFV